jgi:hypoxia up-regulated 1
VKMNEDPVIETTEMKARAKVLEQHLQRLWKRKIPKVKPKPTSSTKTKTSVTETRSAPAEEDTGLASDGKRDPAQEPVLETNDGDGQQVPLGGRIIDEL